MKNTNFKMPVIGGDCNYNKFPQSDANVSNPFMSDSQWLPTHTTPPVPPRNYNGPNSTMLNRGIYSNSTPYPYNTGYGGGLMNTYGGNYGLMNSYGGNYRNFYGGYPSPNNNNMIPGGYFGSLAQNLFSPVFQNSNSMINSMRDLTYTADAVLVSVRMLFDALNLVGDNVYKVRNFLQRYSVGIATLGTANWIFKLIHQLLRLFGLFKNNNENLWKKVKEGGHVDKEKPSLLSNLMVLTAFITACSFMLPKMEAYIKQYVLNQLSKDKNDKNAEASDWNPDTDEFKLVQAKYNFSASNSSELSLVQGQLLKMKPFTFDQNNLPLWVMVADSSLKKGYVPLNHLSPYDISGSSQS